ncbi:uncharacterized protein LOC123443723 isoform X3 [Hordeum vulgare subsp. vulgare]|uniref:uncharacterized protein LOC123443723 isoform X3 n=1 Tax=Hordeum vulgare subsp. vulgare TaxID=112509 RepID=UPI001D1A39D5|nr:uncharacterized protein LOC123443723 isoform X3 [Hordeum vulgare subsp. vulgare]
MEPAVRVELEGLGEDNCREGLCRRPSPHPLRPLLEAQFEREAMAGPDSWWIWRTRPRSGGICQRRRRPGRHPAGGIRRPQIRVRPRLMRQQARRHPSLKDLKLWWFLFYTESRVKSLCVEQV